MFVMFVYNNALTIAFINDHLGERVQPPAAKNAAGLAKVAKVLIDPPVGHFKIPSSSEER